MLTFDGNISTKETTPKFDMDLGLNGMDISQTFSQLNMMKKMAPIAGIVNGKINSKIKLSGNLDPKELTPDVNSLSGDLMGQLLSATVTPEKSTLLTALDNNLNFVNLKNLNLNDVKTALTFTNGKVTVKPFDIKYQDIKVNVGGTHGFDQTMNYTLKLDVPAKYMGTEANALLAKLSPADAKKIETVPVNAILGGNFSNPKISTDVKQATTNLVNNLIKQQKDELVTKGKNSLQDIINNSTKSSSDSTKTDTKTSVKKAADDLLNGLFKKKK